MCFVKALFETVSTCLVRLTHLSTQSLDGLCEARQNVERWVWWAGGLAVEVQGYEALGLLSHPRAGLLLVASRKTTSTARLAQGCQRLLENMNLYYFYKIVVENN